MNIVIDTNRFISALIRDGISRQLISNYHLNFLFPEFEFKEIFEHKEEIINKARLNEKEFNILNLRLLKYVKIIPADLIMDFADEAEQIIGNIDLDDVQFIATALTFNCPIWSDDKHFKKQNVVKVFNTSELLNLVNTLD